MYMKLIVAFITLLFTATFSMAQDSVYLFAYFKNNGKDGLHFAYSNDGYTYVSLKNDSSFLTPTAGKDKLMRDPNILRGADGRFRMVWTVSWNEKGIGYASSQDLVNWSEQQYIPVMEKEDSARNCWAPEISYDKKKKQYMIYWATTISGKFSSDAKVENGYNHRMYYVTTRDFKTFSKTKILYDKGFNVIDASIISSGNRYIMFLKDETPTPPQKNIRTATATKLTGPYSAPSSPITGNYWAEGPTAVYTGTEWIVYFDKYRDKQYGAVTSSDLINWTDISEKIHIPKGLRHGTVIKISQKEFTSFFR
jgi:hypothetical protein